MVVEGDLVRQARLVVGLSRAALRQDLSRSRSTTTHPPSAGPKVTRESCLALSRVRIRRRIQMTVSCS